MEQIINQGSRPKKVTTAVRLLYAIVGIEGHWESLFKH